MRMEGRSHERPRLGGALAVAVLVFAPACSLLVSLDGLSGSAPGDGGSAGDERSSPDSPDGSDAARVDADDAAVNEASSCPAGAIFTSDPKNCGRCGHDCLGGACLVGECEPFAWLDGSRTGGAWKGVAVFGGYVYWTTYTTVGRAKIDGSDVINDFVTGFTLANYLAVDAGGIYVADGKMGGGIYHAPLSGASPTKLVSLDGASGVALTATSLFWCPEQGDVFSAGRDGSNPATWLAMTGAYSIATSADHLYFTNNGGNAVRRVPLDRTTAAEDLAANEQNTFGVAVDEDTVYWTDYGSSLVRARPLLGGGSRTIAAQQLNAGGVAVSVDAIYWTIPSDGTLMKIAK